MGKSLKFKKNPLKGTSRWYIVQKPDSSPAFVRKKATATVDLKELQELTHVVLLQGQSGAVLLGPGQAMQVYGQHELETDVLSLYKFYLEKGVIVFKKLFGGVLRDIIVDPTLEDAIENTALVFPHFLQGAVPTPTYGIEYEGKYLLDVNAVIRKIRGTEMTQRPDNDEDDDMEVLEDDTPTPVPGAATENKDKAWKDQDATERQREKLASLGIKADPTWTRGQASKIIQDKLNNIPATERQLKMLKTLGIPAPDNIRRSEASKLIKDERRRRGLS